MNYVNKTKKKKIFDKFHKFSVYFENVIVFAFAYFTTERQKENIFSSTLKFPLPKINPKVYCL